MKRSSIIILLVIVSSFLIGAALYPYLPEIMASHWNAREEVDGYMPKNWGLFIAPLFLLGLFVLFQIIPKIEPLKDNIKKFRKYFDGFVVILALFFLYMYVLSILWNLGWRFNMGLMLIPAIGAIFYYAGLLTEKSQRNWFIGIRTPWTLSSDQVWKKTNELGGKLFKLMGVLALVGILSPKYGVFLVVIPAIAIATFVIVYSYIEYKKEEEG